MYIPPAFVMPDIQECTRFVQQHGFGILFAQVGDRPLATHVPMLLDDGATSLCGHMARANPQWAELDGREVLAIFSGPHAYVSPEWYEESPAVPTWNYVAVHVHGRCRIVRGGEELPALLADVVRRFEPDAPLLAQTGGEFFRRMADGAVGFVIDVTSLEGVAKCSQNKSLATRRSVIAHLRGAQDDQARALAGWMERALPAADEGS